MDGSRRTWGIRFARLPVVWRIAGGLAAAGLVVLVSPWALHVVAHAPTVCPLRALFGIPCPGCGTTRAIFALTSGHPITSLQLNPLGMVLCVLAVLVFARYAALVPKRFFDRSCRVLVRGGLALALAAWIVTLTRRFLF
ncbi:MAG: DUF2752 domain-containing protein [Verrucomicrobia bacterium]|nr:DUF2752 domain-containing protein [Verrucomicrobiota bacterium]